MPNRLATATSPTCCSTATTPSTGGSGSRRRSRAAAERDVPVFLSVGYSACHWCHVMAHESFEDAEVSRVLNEGYVAVKVDREERPDVDAVYMAATQALTGQGGWPMTVLMTPDREPFFCGTYFPKEQLLQVLDAVSDAWRTRRDEVLASSTHIVGALREATTPPPHALTTGHLDAAAAALRPQFDSARGGFGRAPKFPPSLALEFLLRHHGRTGDAGALEMVERHLHGDGPRRDLRPAGRRFRALCRRHRLGRAALREDALRQRSAACGSTRTGGGPPGRRSPSGSRARPRTSCCATSVRVRAASPVPSTPTRPGSKGLTYAWSRPLLDAVLGDDDGERAADLLRVTEDGTFEDGLSTLQLPVDPADPVWWADVRARLLTARARSAPAAPRRQGGHRLERAGRRGPGRPGRDPSANPDTSRPRLGRRRSSSTPTSSTAGSGVLAGGRGRQRGGRRRRLRRPGRGPARPAPGHRRAPLARPPPGDLLDVALRHVRRAGRWLPRHRRRRRAALHPPASARRQRRAVRDDVPGRSAC